MSNIDIIRAWKDEEYRNNLSQEQRSQLPENPAGMVELSEADMEALAGGYKLGISPVLSPGENSDSNDDGEGVNPPAMVTGAFMPNFPGIFNGGYQFWR